MKKRGNQKSAAIVTIHRADEMTPAGRRAIAKWLRMHASYLLKYGKEYSARFTGRYRYVD